MNPRKLLSTCLLFAPFFLAPLRAQVWENRNQLLIDSAHPSGAKAGSALAVGDFDGDGDEDLAVGAPNETVSGLATAGRVRVYLSDGTSGLVVSNANIAGSEASMRLGTAVVAGDFNHDGKDELVVGAPGDDVGSFAEAGSIRVWSLSAGVWTQIAYFDQDTGSIPGGAEANDHFGQSLAVGDFDDDTDEDLAVGVPDEDIGSTLEAGLVNVLYGSGSGLTSGTDSQYWYRSGGGIDGTAAQNQFLGRALAAGDFDSDGVDDLAIGVADTFAGHVVVLYGVSVTGLGTGDQQAIFPADFPQPPSGGEFSAALAAGELDDTAVCSGAGTCADDLIVGMPNATVQAPNMVSFFNAGAVFVLHGSQSFNGLDPATAVRITENELAHLNGPGTGEHLGAAVAVGPLGGSAFLDLAFGAPDESVPGPASSGGTAATLLGGASPLSSGFSQVLWEEPGFLSNPPTSLDRFGTAVAIGDFDHDGQGDLAVGIPGFNGGGIGDTGAVQILYGALFADGFGSNGLTNWSNF